MAADAEKFPLPERIFLAYTAMSRWAGRGMAARPDGKRPGCANPLTLIKGLIFLLVLVLLPLFMLPMLVVRLGQLGRTGFRYGASVDVAAGDQARWGHGTLPPGQGTAVISQGTAAMAGRDPGFHAGTLTNWAVAATALLCQSLVSGDAICTRTFMANGLYDAHQALLELRARNAVSCAGAWQAVGAHAGAHDRDARQAAAGPATAAAGAGRGRGSRAARPAGRRPGRRSALRRAVAARRGADGLPGHVRGHVDRGRAGPASPDRAVVLVDILRPLPTEHGPQCPGPAQNGRGPRSCLAPGTAPRRLPGLRA